jgi:predicted nucleotidyltransferase
MALTTAQAFTSFLEKISPTDDQRAEITNKRRKTEEYLREAFPASSTLPLKRVILIGSADRGTIVRPVNDVDVMAEFTNKDSIFEQYRAHSDDFLQRIRTGLNAKTSIKKIGARGQAVRLFYTSGAHVDVAPTFKWSGSGYALPKGHGGWMTTDPEAQAIWFSERRAVIGSNLTPMCKLVRRWNAVHSHRFESFHLEIMVASMFKSIGSNFSSGDRTGSRSPIRRDTRAISTITSRGMPERRSPPDSRRRSTGPSARSLPKAGETTPRQNGFGGSSWAMSSLRSDRLAMLTRDQSFERLRRNLELTGLQEQAVAKRQQNVREAVAAQLTVVDVDRKYKDHGARAVLELVRKALLVEFTRTPAISRNGQAVTITFSDFVVDVVPAFTRPWWAWSEGWEICDSGSDSWITTNPTKHVEISSAANRAHGGHLVPRIKQLKAWNRTAGEPLRSFHLEALAWSIFGTSWLWNSGQKWDWTSARYFFDKARSELRNQLHDPAGTGSDVAAYLHGPTLDSAVSKVTSAYERCVRAETCAKGGDLAGMHKAYGQVFGDYYPD